MLRAREVLETRISGAGAGMLSRAEEVRAPDAALLKRERRVDAQIRTGDAGEREAHRLNASLVVAGVIPIEEGFREANEALAVLPQPY